MQGPRTLRFRVVGELMLVVHADIVPSESDWSQMLRTRDDAKPKSILVVAPPKASINASQRADVQTYLAQTGARIAVLTDSKLVRGAALAVAWFGVPVRAFPSKGLGDALTFLEVKPERLQIIERAIQDLDAELA